MYDDSEGMVLLLAAVEHREPTSSSAALDHQERLQRTLSAPWLTSLRVAPTSSSCRGGGGGGTGAWAGQKEKKRKKVADEAYAHVEVFPDDDYIFTIESHLLVMAETQAAAEDLIFNFQVGDQPAGRLLWRFGGPLTPVEAPHFRQFFFFLWLCCVRSHENLALVSIPKDP